MEHHSPVLETVFGVVTLLLIAVAIRSLTKRFNFPFSIALVLIGMGFSWLSDMSLQAQTLLPKLEISPDIILYVFLPTLVFESAYNLDSRLLRDNILQVLALAVPGLLLSTFIIGFIVSLATPIPLMESLLLGAILSATDPVAVVALFKQLGTPRRLTVLVEGESLFNDATAIVVSRILIAVVLAGNFSLGSITGGGFDFLTVFIGGVVVGWVMGMLTAYILGLVESDPYIEITLTTVLAYLSFLIAEEMFHVSGVMATVMAGITIGGWGRMKISASVRAYLEHFWEYLAFVANALIFLLVGLNVKILELSHSFEALVWVVLAMLVSRAVVVYGIVPLVGRIKGAEPVSIQYRSVMFWGGLRGAIALAIVLSLPDFPNSELFAALVTGAVLFTLLVQGLSINWLVKYLGLDKPTLADRFALLEGTLSSKQKSKEIIPELMKGGQFSASIAEKIRKKVEIEIKEFKGKLEELKTAEMSPQDEENLLLLFGFAEEKSMFIKMLNNGHLSEKAFRELIMVLEIHIDSLRYGKDINHTNAYFLPYRRLERLIIAIAEKIPFLNWLAEKIRIGRIAMDYELAWGRYQGSETVLQEVENLAAESNLTDNSVHSVLELYGSWHEATRRMLDQTAEQYPEFVRATQERLGKRLLLLTEASAIDEKMDLGTIPGGIAEEILARIYGDIRKLRGLEIGKLMLEPLEMLKQVPFFRELAENEFADLVAHTHSVSVSAKDIVIRQGERKDSLFLIARGVVRILREDNGETKELATLIAGDFFGEMALLHNQPRTATVRAVTPCTLYELNRIDLEKVMEAHPSIRKTLEEADRKRQAELHSK